MNQLRLVCRHRDCDLSDEIASRNDSCPLVGRCPQGAADVPRRDISRRAGAAIGACSAIDARLAALRRI